MTQHFGHEVSGELGVDRWLGATRLRLDYEITKETDPGRAADSFLHGPRLSLLLARSAPKIPRFPSGPPNNTLSLELSLELLGRGAFEQPVLLPAFGYSYTFGF